MSNSNFYFIALKPSLTEELESRVLQSKLLAPENQEAIVKPLLLPLSFQFNTDEDGIFELGNGLQQTFENISSFQITFKKIVFNETFKQIAIQPESHLQINELITGITRELLGWNNFANAPVSLDFPKLEVALARANWSEQAFQDSKLFAVKHNINLVWNIETVSMMEWTNFGWNEKFFFPLSDQRTLRKQSNAILQDK